MFFTIDRKSSSPVYIQLANEIRSMIKNNDFAKGYRMTPERELAASLGISRGTAKKAYEILIKEGLLEASQGSGTYVTGKSIACQINPKDAVDSLINSLLEAGYSLEEIESICLLGINSRIKSSVKVAVVECNIETIRVIEKQLKYYNIYPEAFLLSDVMNFFKADDIFEAFDLILTTTTHMSVLEKILPKTYLAGKISRIAVAPDLHTIMELSSICDLDSSSIGIIAKSPRFLEIIRNCLKNNFNLTISNESCVLVADKMTLKIGDFIRSKRCLIVPPVYSFDIDNNLNHILLDFYKNNGKIITFNYLIEKGSLLHLEELITR